MIHHTTLDLHLVEISGGPFLKRAKTPASIMPMLVGPSVDFGQSYKCDSQPA